MMRSNLSKGLFVLMMVLAGVGCASTPAKPEWAGKNWKEQKKMYFSGIAAQCPDISCARDRSYAHAVSAVADYIGITVQTHTDMELSNNWHQLESKYTAVSEELNLEHIEVEKFEVSREDNFFTGYILLQIPVYELEAAKRKVTEKAAQAAARKKQKAALGIFSVQTASDCKEAGTYLENLLRKQDYKIGKNGQPIYLQVEKENCRRSHFEELQICEIYFSISWQDKKHVFSGVGYGKDKAQSRREAIGAAFSTLPADLLETL